MSASIESRTSTERAVAQLRAYARYMDEHAEGIIGNIDAPNYVADGGIRVSFTLLEHESVPILAVEKEHIVLEAWKAGAE